MERINQEDLRKTSNKVGLLFISQIFSLIVMSSILSKAGIYNQSTDFMFNMSILLIIACLFFPCNFKKMFLRNKKINILEGAFYVFLFLSIYFPLTIIISNLLSPLYSTSVVEKKFTMEMFILQGITIPVVEEIVYKGILLEDLRKYGDSFAIVISALIFGMMHGFRVIHSFAFGIFTGIIYIKTEQLSYPILFHFITDLFSMLILSWINSFFTIENVNIGILILTIISMTIAFALYIIAKRKNYPEIKNIRAFQIKKIIPQLKKDREKYKIFFQEGGIIFSLIVFFIITSMEVKLIISKLK